MKRIQSWDLPPIPAVILSIISVQGGAAIAKTLFPALGVYITVMMRIGLSALILLVVFRPTLSKVSSAQWRLVIPYGIALGAMNVIFYMAIERIPLGLAVALEFFGPLVLAVFTSRRLVDFLWIVLAAAGILMLSPWSADAHDFIGILLALLAGALWAMYIIMGGKISKAMNGGEAVAIGMCFATLTVAPFVLNTNWSIMTPAFLYQGAALGLLSSVIPFTLEMKALKTLSSKTFSILMSLEPAFAALSGLVFLGEKLRILEWAAILLIVIASTGVAISARSGRETA